jgi:hypothetical protein
VPTWKGAFQDVLEQVLGRTLVAAAQQERGAQQGPRPVRDEVHEIVLGRPIVTFPPLCRVSTP